jgi:HAD superfamily hydrolase (TIGR01549 family)
MKFDGIFFDSGNTIYGFGQEQGGDPTSGQVAEQGPQRAAAALRWLGHEVTDVDVAAKIAEVAGGSRQAGPAWTDESLVTALFQRLGLEPRRDEVVYVTGVFSGIRYRSWVYPGVAETLEELSRLGLFIGLIANTSVPGWVMDRNFGGVGLLDYLKVRIYSGDEGVEKPDPEIFRLAEARSGLRADRLIYMGDKVEADMAGARAADWSSILFRSVTDSSQGQADFEIDAWAELPALLAQ